MSKSKVDFIADLFADKRLNSSFKERFFALAAGEIKKINTKDEKNWKELQELKNLVEKRIIGGANDSKIKKAIELKIHNPKKTSQCLKLFKTGNKLKWITHVFPNSGDSQFDYTKITREAISEFKSISNDLPFKLGGFISVFLQQKKLKPRDNKIFYLGDYYDTWWAPKLINWCKENPGLHPDTNEHLSQYIITPFKKGIEIRDGRDLENAIKYRLRKTHGEEILSILEIDFSGIKKNTRFFTGVDQLMTGIAAIFSPIIQRKSISNKVLIATRIEEYKEQFVSVVEIIHLDSDCEADLMLTSIFNGDLLTTKEELHSLCDWHISANFNNGTYTLLALDSFGDNGIQKLDQKVEGFTHKLIFF